MEQWTRLLYEQYRLAIAAVRRIEVEADLWELAWNLYCSDELLEKLHANEERKAPPELTEEFEQFAADITDAEIAATNQQSTTEDKEMFAALDGFNRFLAATTNLLLADVTWKGLRINNYANY